MRGDSRTRFVSPSETAAETAAETGSEAEAEEQAPPAGVTPVLVL